MVVPRKNHAFSVLLAEQLRSSEKTFAAVSQGCEWKVQRPGRTTPDVNPRVLLQTGNLKDHPHKERHFLEHVTGAFKDDPRVNAKKVTRAGFRTLAKHVSAGAIENIKGILPKEAKEPWPAEKQSEYIQFT